MASNRPLNAADQTGNRTEDEVLIPIERTLSQPPFTAATTGGMAERRFCSVSDGEEVDGVAMRIDLPVSWKLSTSAYVVS